MRIRVVLYAALDACVANHALVQCDVVILCHRSPLRARLRLFGLFQVLNGCLEWGGADLAEQFIVTTHGKRRCDA